MTTTTIARPDRALAPVTFLELEITGKCQLSCGHCYSESSMASTHGTMTTEDWKRVITEAVAYGMETMQFIGGEPTMHPHLLDLVQHTLDAGMQVYVFTNLVAISDAMWTKFQHPRVRLGTSWYAADAKTHAEITGSENSYYRTRENIQRAVTLGIPVHAGIVRVIDGQDVEAAKAELLALGVESFNVDDARAIGRAASGKLAAIPELCGKCGDGRAAIGPDGDLVPCVLGRALIAGNVKRQSIAEILVSGAWTAIMETIPNRGSCITCTPADSNDCNPSKVI